MLPLIMGSHESGTWKMTASNLQMTLATLGFAAGCSYNSHVMKIQASVTWSTDEGVSARASDFFHHGATRKPSSPQTGPCICDCNNSTIPVPSSGSFVLAQSQVQQEKRAAVPSNPWGAELPDAAAAGYLHLRILTRFLSSVSRPLSQIAWRSMSAARPKHPIQSARFGNRIDYLGDETSTPMEAEGNRGQVQLRSIRVPTNRPRFPVAVILDP